MGSSQRTPLSLGRPLRPLQPRSRAGDELGREPHHQLPKANMFEVTARYYIPSSLRPPIVQYLAVLDQFLGTRPNSPRQPIVIAIDGLDRNAVQMMIANLNHHMTSDVGCTVRVMGNASSRQPVDPSPHLDFYIRQIHDWAAMWQTIFRAPLPTQSSARPCIYLLPLSPMMATIRASNLLALTGTHNTADLWRWLASHWEGHPRPDLTINIEDVTFTSVNREVLCMQGCRMNTIIVTKASDDGAELVAEQLGRVSREVDECIGLD